MRILLIYPDILPAVRGYKGYFNQGISSIAAALLNIGHEVRLLHLLSTPRRDEFVEIVKGFDPAVAGISSTTNQFNTARLVAGWLREASPNTVIVSGGIHSILNADQVIQLEEFDMVCRGEGEYPMAQLAASLERGEDGQDTSGMWIRRKDKTTRRNPLPPLIENLDDLPCPSRDVWDYPSLQMESRGIASVMLSRGCPRACTYCCNRAISNVYMEGGTKTYFRVRSVPSAIAELLSIKRKYPFVKMFNFDDDNLFLNKDWAREFTRRYAEEIALPFTCNLYPGLITEDRVELLKSAGCVDLRIGLESGNEDLRANVLGRKISNEKMRQAYRLCREAGIHTRSFVMVGLPGETPDMVIDTMKFVAEEKIGIAQYSIYYPYRQTELFDYSVSMGYVSESSSGDEDYFTGSVLKMDTIGKNQIFMFRTYFPVFVGMYRMVGMLPSAIRKTARACLRKFLLASWLPFILNPFSALMDVLKVIVPARINLNKIQWKIKKAH